MELAFKRVGIELEWKGEGVNEKGIVKNILRSSKEVIIEATKNTKLTSDVKDNYIAKGDVIIEIDPRYFRPTEVDYLQGDASKALKELGWKPTHTIHDLVDDMVESDIRNTVKDFYLINRGCEIFNFCEM